MICPFCGAENEDGRAACTKCGYKFAVSLSFPEKKSELVGDNQDSVQYNETIQNNADKTASDLDIPQVTSETTEDEKKTTTESIRERVAELDASQETEKYSKDEKAEFLLSAILAVVAIGVLIHECMTTPLEKWTTDFVFLAIMGVIGLIAGILYMVFEKSFPGSIPGTIIRTIVLILLLEYHNYFTVPLFVIVIGVSIYFFLMYCFGGASARFLGIISLMLLPFGGVVVAIMISLFLNGTSGRKKKRGR